MLAQVTLIPMESKKLIAKAVAQMEKVKRAMANGIIAIAPSSSTYFITTELLGKPLPTYVWACGVVVPKGTCVESGPDRLLKSLPPAAPAKKESLGVGDPGGFIATHVIHKGNFSIGERLDSILNKLGPGDIYIKGGNALDHNGNIGILTAAKMRGGTSGLVLQAQPKKGFGVIIPMGLEKLIPIPVEEAAAITERRDEFEYGMGLQCVLYPEEGKGKVVTEIDAIRILSGAVAVPIACGGIGGAEGAVTMVIEGEKAKVHKAIRYIEECKGAKLPSVNVELCESCGAKSCVFRIQDMIWGKSYIPGTAADRIST
jgi:hypothetical protein